MTEPPRPVCRITLNHALAMRLAGYAIALLYVVVGIVVTLGSSLDHQFSSGRAVILSGLVGILVAGATIVAWPGLLRLRSS